MKTRRNQPSKVVEFGGMAAVVIGLLLIWNATIKKAADVGGAGINFVIAALSLLLLWAVVSHIVRFEMRMRIAGSLNFDCALEELFNAQSGQSVQRDASMFRQQKQNYLKDHGGLNEVVRHIQKTGQLPGLDVLPVDTPQERLRAINYYTVRALEAR